MAVLLEPGLLELPEQVVDSAPVRQAVRALRGTGLPRCVLPDRLGDLVDLVTDPPDGLRVLVVDHHRAGRPYGDVRVVDPNAPATVVLVTSLLDLLDVQLDEAMASGLVPGAGLRHGLLPALVHHRAGPRVGRSPGLGWRTSCRVAENLLDGTLPFASVRLMGRIVGRLVLEPLPPGSPSLVWSSVGADELAELGVEAAELDRVIDIIRLTDEADAAMFLLQTPDGDWRVSLRSGGAVDVSTVCAALGGGGHARAAGFTSRQTLVKTVGEVRRRLAASTGARPGQSPWVIVPPHLTGLTACSSSPSRLA